jgi:hypothetical protein
MMHNSGHFTEQIIKSSDILIDPESAVKRLDGTPAWVWPLLLTSIGAAIIGLAWLPIMLRVLEQSLLLGVPEDQARDILNSFVKYQYVSVALGPLLLLLKVALSTWLLYMSCILLNVRATVRQLFALLAQCSLITLLELLTVYTITRLRGADVQSPVDLMPGLGLDLLIHPASAPLLILIRYASVFNVWYVVVLSLGLAYLSGCSKKKAFAATIPVWLIPLLLNLGLALSF